MTIDGRATCPVQANFDPLSPAFLVDPFAVLDAFRHETPVFYAPSIDYYVVTRYADIEAVFLDHETYSAAPAQTPRRRSPLARAFTIASAPRLASSRRRSRSKH